MIRAGTKLLRNRQPYRWIGLAAPQAATYWPVNWGCGAQLGDGDLDAMFSAAPPGTVTSFWATQAMAFNNKTTHALDFTAIDRVVSAAARHGQLLDFVLGTQQGYCSDGHFKDAAWYGGGYRSSFNDDGRGLEPLSYWDWIHTIVPRYASSPATAAWTLVSEPEASDCASGFAGADCYGHLTCPPEAAATLRSFFDVVGGEVKRVDPAHLVSSGTMGGGQCGTAGDEFTFVHRSPSVDVCELRDYTGGAGLPDGIAAMAARCLQAGKVPVIGELGIKAGSAPGCPSTSSRRDRVAAESAAAFRAGIAGVLVWQWGPSAPSCGYDVSATDPVTSILGPR